MVGNRGLGWWVFCLYLSLCVWFYWVSHEFPSKFLDVVVSPRSSSYFSSSPYMRVFPAEHSSHRDFMDLYRSMFLFSVPVTIVRVTPSVVPGITGRDVF